MFFTRIELIDFLGTNGQVGFDLSPFTLFCGPNASGKSRIRDAINFVLTGDLCRGVTKKKDMPLLVSEGQRHGAVSIKAASFDLYRDIPEGHANLTGDGAVTANEFTPYCTDMNRFSTLSEKSRREFMLRLIGKTANTKDVRRRLLAGGCNEAKIEEVVPLLRAGLGPAEDYAKEQARQAKANWRAITSQTWSKRNGENWGAQRPATALPELPFPVEEFEARSKKSAAEIEAQSDLLTSMIGRRKAATFQDRFAKTAEEPLDAIEKQLDTARNAASELVEYEKKVAGQMETLSPESERFDGIIEVECPHCYAISLLDLATKDVSVVTDEYSKWQETRDLEICERYDSLVAEKEKVEARKAELSADIVALEMKLSAARRAAEQLEKAKAYVVDDEPTPTDEQVQEVRNKYENMRYNRAQVNAEVSEYRKAVLAVEEANLRAVKASEYHTSVIEWLDVANLLSPSGILSQLSREALIAVNRALSDISDEAGIVPISLDPEMNVLSNGRPYHLLSNSERWRADACLCVMIARISGLNFAILDEFDVLDIPSRNAIFRWLASITDETQVILLGTLKIQPDLSTVQNATAHWLGG